MDTNKINDTEPPMNINTEPLMLTDETTDEHQYRTIA